MLYRRTSNLIAPWSGGLRGSAAATLFVGLAALAAGPTQAAVKAKASPTAGASAGTEDRAVRELARTITTRLPPAPAKGCDPNARAAVKAAVETVLVDAKATPELAVSAIEFARNQPPPLDSCRDGALADSATESAGNGEVVDEADTVRGFTLYAGPWPPPPRPTATLVSNVTTAEPAAEPAKPAVAKPKARPRRRGHRIAPART